MNLILYKPKLEDYWCEEKLYRDISTMSYNSGWDVSYNGYNYELGTIEYSVEKKLNLLKLERI